MDNTAILLGRALMIFALSTAVVGGVAIIQALARHHTGTARAREVELALGLTRAQQTAARLLSGLLPAGVATILATIGALAATRIEPIGAIHLYEPHPGPAVERGGPRHRHRGCVRRRPRRHGPHRRAPPIDVAPMPRCGRAPS